MSQGNAMPERPLAGPGRSNLRTYFGGCDCGAVRYQVELELRARDPRTQSVWEHSVSPPRFQLQTGHDSLIGYQFAAESAHHFFCTRCQARAFSHVAPELGAGYYTFDLKALYARELYTPSASVSVRGY